MNQLRDSQAATASAVLPLLRRAAAALRGTPDRPAFAATLNEFMQLVPALRAAWVELPGASGTLTSEVFSREALTLPLRAGPAVTGVLRHRLEGPPLDAERLRVLGAVAELLGAILEQTSQKSAGTEARALLALVLEHVPCGAACFSSSGLLLAANPAAIEFAGGAAAVGPLLLRAVLAGPAAGSDAAAASVAAPGAQSAAPPTLRRVHLVRVGERLGLVHVHPGLAEDGNPAGLIALIHDLGQRARAFHAVIARETYRALWLDRPLALAVLAASDQPGELQQAADEIRAGIGPAAESGPMDADAVGILAPDTKLAALRAIVRRTRGLGAIAGLRVGLAALDRDQRAPENFVNRAVGGLTPLERFRRPRLLLWDTSPSVTEALEVALRFECDAVRCHDRVTGGQLLAAHTFDAIFAKIELDEWDQDIGFLRRALEVQPGLKAFIVTDAPGLYSATIPQLPAGTPVFRKPFQVAAVRKSVREQLAAPAGTG